MPYSFNLPSFFPVQNLDEYGRSLFRKGFGGFAGFGDGGRRGPRQSNNLIDQLFPNDFGGPSRPPPPPRREPRDTKNRGSIGGGSIGGGSAGGGIYGGGGSIGGGSIGGGNFGVPNSGQGSISSLPKVKETFGKSAALVFRVGPIHSKNICCVLCG